MTADTGYCLFAKGKGLMQSLICHESGTAPSCNDRQHIDASRDQDRCSDDLTIQADPRLSSSDSLKHKDGNHRSRKDCPADLGTLRT